MAVLFLFFFSPYSPVVSHAMSNLDFSTMEDWLTAFMVWILALFVLLLCFGIFSLVRKNSFLSEKLVIGSITHKPLPKKPRPLVSSWTSGWCLSIMRPLQLKCGFKLWNLLLLLLLLLYRGHKSGAFCVNNLHQDIKIGPINYDLLLYIYVNFFLFWINVFQWRDIKIWCESCGNVKFIGRKKCHLDSF